MKNVIEVHSRAGVCVCPYCDEIVGRLPPFCEHLISIGKDNGHIVFKFKETAMRNPRKEFHEKRLAHLKRMRPRNSVNNGRIAEEEYCLNKYSPYGANPSQATHRKMADELGREYRRYGGDVLLGQYISEESNGTIPDKNPWKGENMVCSVCGITEKQREKLPPMNTGIDHPDYRYTKSFYIAQNWDKKGEHRTYFCPECHKEKLLEGLFKTMDILEAKGRLKVKGNKIILKKEKDKNPVVLIEAPNKASAERLVTYNKAAEILRRRGRGGANVLDKIVELRKPKFIRKHIGGKVERLSGLYQVTYHKKINLNNPQSQLPKLPKTSRRTGILPRLSIGKLAWGNSAIITAVRNADFTNSPVAISGDFIVSRILPNTYYVVNRKTKKTYKVTYVHDAYSIGTVKISKPKKGRTKPPLKLGERRPIKKGRGRPRKCNPSK